jgi:sporulation protein YtfJ
MENIRGIVDVNTVVGDPVETPDGTVIIPVSRVACGFAAGGSAFAVEQPENAGAAPFGGGSGAGVSVQPVGFLVVKGDNVRLLPVDGNHLAERLLDLAPQVLEKIEEMKRARGAEPPGR